MSMPSRDEIFEKVQAALVDALGVDDDEVTPTKLDLIFVLYGGIYVE